MRDACGKSSRFVIRRADGPTLSFSTRLFSHLDRSVHVATCDMSTSATNTVQITTIFFCPAIVWDARYVSSSCHRCRMEECIRARAHSASAHPWLGTRNEGNIVGRTKATLYRRPGSSGRPRGQKKQANALIDPNHTHSKTLPVRDDDGPSVDDHGPSGHPQADDHGPSADDHVPSGHPQADDQVLCETT